MGQTIDQAALDRLQVILKDPTSVERRTDRISDFGRDSIRWHVSQQVRIPVVNGDTPTEQYVLLSLGFFGKKRHPDLVAVDGAGDALVILDRNVRAQVLTELYQPRLILQLTDIADQLRLAQHIEVLIRESETAAMQHLVQFRKDIAGRQALHALVTEATVSEALEQLARTNHVLVWVKAVPGESAVISYSYTESLPYPTLHKAWTGGGKLGIARVWYLLRWLMMELGLLAVPIRLRLNGANHSQAYYFLVDPPSGMEIEAAYWHRISVRQRPGPSGAPVEVETWKLHHESSSTVLACRHDERDAHKRWVSIDLRLRRERLLLPLLLVSLLGAACWIGRSRSDGFDKVLPLVAVIPGALLGVLAERLSDLGRRVSRTLQLHFVALSVLAVAYGAASLGDLISDTGGPSWLNDRTLNRALAFGSVWVLGLLCYPVFFRGKFNTKIFNPAYVRYRDVRSFRQDRRASAIVVALASLSAAIYLTLDRVDLGVHDWLLKHFDADPEWFWKALDHGSSARSNLIVLTLAMLLAIVVGGVVSRPGVIRRAVIVLTGLGVLFLAVMAMKGLLGRQRPVGPTLLDESGNSMPSGHAAFTVFTCLAVYRNVVERIRRRRNRALCVVGLVSYVVLVYFERLLANAHYFSDVVVGGFIGALAFLVVLRLSRIRYSTELGFYRTPS